MIFPSLQLTSRILGQVWRRFVRPLGTVKAGLPDKRQTLWGHCCARHFPGRLLRSRETVLARPAPLLGTPVCASEVRARSAPCPVHRPYYDPRPGPRQSARVPYSLFFDPHTGIPLAEDTDSNATISHAPLPYIVKENARLRPHYMICFDQSVHRKHNPASMWTSRGLSSATTCGTRASPRSTTSPMRPFCSWQNTTTLQEVRDRMIALGIPEQTLDTIRLQPIQ